MKAENGAYYGFEKDVDVDESTDCTSIETEADTYNKYICSELQLPNKGVMKWMARIRQILRNIDGNTESNGNCRGMDRPYRA